MPFRKPARHVDRVFLHCSASDDPDHDDIATIRSWHVDGNGWSDVGYHYFIRKGRDARRRAVPGAGTRRRRLATTRARSPSACTGSRRRVSPALNTAR